MIAELKSGYSVEVDTVDKESWYSILEKFDDANIYQTWSYEAVRSGEKNLSHLVLRREGEVVAAAQARIVRIPYLNIGMAYLRWGPMWRLHGKEADEEVFAQAIRALRNEYVCRRRLLIRVLPLLFHDQAKMVNSILKQEEFAQPAIEEAQRTLLVNLSPSLEELRKGLDQKWRNCLNRAEKNGLQIIEGYDDDLFGTFIEIHRQMHRRKKFVETSDVNQFRMMQRDLPSSFKMKILLAFFDGKPASGVVCSSIGDMGIYLFGGTSNAGLSTKGSYLLQWEALSWLRGKGAKWYNLHGINPIKNPGTYRFKEGLCGVNGKDVYFLGAYDACENIRIGALFQFANLARVLFRNGKVLLSGLRRQIEKTEAFFKSMNHIP
jgi:lipid II:glycine glycyltransferase (peptidoglycan interpeptide bridge formation enzyme)